MPPLTDETRRSQILELLELEHRNVRDYVVWKQVAAEELRREFEGVEPKLVNELLYEFVRDGGCINEVEEKREGLPNGMRYEFRFRIDGVKVYVEARIEDDRDPYLWLVSFHQGWS